MDACRSGGGAVCVFRSRRRPRVGRDEERPAHDGDERHGPVHGRQARGRASREVRLQQGGARARRRHARDEPGRRHRVPRAPPGRRKCPGGAVPAVRLRLHEVRETASLPARRRRDGTHPLRQILHEKRLFGRGGRGLRRSGQHRSPCARLDRRRTTSPTPPAA